MLGSAVGDALVGEGGRSWALPGVRWVGIRLQLCSPWGEPLRKGGVLPHSHVLRLEFQGLPCRASVQFSLRACLQPRR